MGEETGLARFFIFYTLHQKISMFF